MAITISLPDSVERQLASAWNDDLDRKALEAVVVEGYRQAILSRGQVSELLGLDFWETEAFLKDREASLGHGLHEVAKDIATLKRLHRK